MSCFCVDGESTSAAGALDGGEAGSASALGQHSVLTGVTVGGTELTDAQVDGTDASVLGELEVDQGAGVAVRAARQASLGEGAGVPSAVGTLLSGSQDDQR